MKPGKQLYLALNEFLRTPTKKAAGATIEERFRNFHELNPHVYRAMVSLARKLQSQGHKRVSTKGLFEFLRMNKRLHTKGDDFKLNNDFTSRYARLICDRDPELAPLFQLRRKTTA